MSDLLRQTGKMSLPKLAELLRNGGMTTSEQFEAADMLDEATAEIRRLRQELAARSSSRTGWGTPW